MTAPSPSPTGCAFAYWDICFVQPPEQPFVPFFGFATFITALTLIAVVFTISDVRYKFRIAVAPLPLIPISYWATAIIGALVLTTDVWFFERWTLPAFFQSQILWQGVLGGSFFFLVLVWFHFAFLKPPTFGWANAKRYTSVLYRIIVRGDDAELPAIANELGLSMRQIVDCCPDTNERTASKPGRTARYAHDLLLLLGNRKFCRHVVASAPGTAIALFQRMSESRKYLPPVRQFATNLSTEAILNTDSILYHEDEGFYSGLLGYTKPFSATIYGDYKLVEGLGQNFGSPLDIDYKSVRSWTAPQLSAYCRALLITFENYLAVGSWRTHSYSISRAFDNVEKAFSDSYKLNDPQTPYFPSDVLSRLDAAVSFTRDVVDAIGAVDPLPKPLKMRQRNLIGVPRTHDIYDEVADLMFKLVLAASYVTADTDRSWTIQHNTVWTNLFGLTSKNKAWSIVQYKTRRLIFETIKRFDFLDYQSARVLGMMLNVLGFKTWAGQSRSERSLQKALVKWTRSNFIRRWKKNPEVAVSGLPANITFDAENKRFVKAYAKGLEREAPKEYLDVDD